MWRSSYCGACRTRPAAASAAQISAAKITDIMYHGERSVINNGVQWHVAAAAVAQRENIGNEKISKAAISVAKIVT